MFRVYGVFSPEIKKNTNNFSQKLHFYPPCPATQFLVLGLGCLKFVAGYQMGTFREIDFWCLIDKKKNEIELI